MLRLSKQQKKDFYDKAELELINGMKVEWPLFIQRINGLDHFCSKCNAPFTAKANEHGYASNPTCPVHGKSKDFYSFQREQYNLHYEDKGNGEFRIYKLKRSLDEKSLKFNIEIVGILFYLKDDAFFLEREDQNYTRRPIDVLVKSIPYSHINMGVPNNIDKMVDNEDFMKETGLLKYYFFQRDKMPDIEKNRERLRKELSKKGMSAKEDMIKAMEFTKKKHQNIPVVEKAGYDSLQDYMIDQKLYQTVRNMVVGGITIEGIDSKAERIEDVLSDEVVLLERIHEIEDFRTDRDILKLKNTFSLAQNKDAFFSMINSPIIRNERNNSHRDTSAHPYVKETRRSDLLSGLHELLLFGYEIESVWKYVQKMELIQGLSPNETVEKLRDYVKLTFMHKMLIKGHKASSLDDLNMQKADFELFPEDLLIKLNFLKKYHFNKSLRSTDAILKINTFLMENISFSTEEYEISRIVDFNDAYKFTKKHGIDLLERDKKSGFNMRNYYLVKDISGKDSKICGIVGVNHLNTVNEFFSKQPWSTEDIQMRSWAIRKIQSWARKKNLTVTTK